MGGDAGLPYALSSDSEANVGHLWQEAIFRITGQVWEELFTEHGEL